MSNTTRLRRDYIDEALVQLEEVDADAANALRAWIDAYYLLQDEPLEICEMLTRMEHRLTTLKNRVHELAMCFSRMGRGEYEENGDVSER